MRQVKKKKPLKKIIYEPASQVPKVLQPKHYNTVSFLTSSPTLAQCPLDDGWEVAFAGRSNAGKSSALNCLTSARLARTSKTPGRTQLINFFNVDEQRRLVDLPGYGYAKVPTTIRREWGHHLGDYVTQRKCLAGMVIMMDIRHPLTDFDLQLIDVAARRDLPVHILLTKADKLKRGPAANQLQFVRNALLSITGNLSVQLFSSLKSSGTAEAWDKLDEWFKLGAYVATESEAAIDASLLDVPDGDESAN
ncbi:MAG TPA: ribosome biogenesis GTP-binding protein YihA/YsxC [Marinospirillum sp.]|uniref:ribosome biogenesis GTP-binding protein YihA/YsxC n=1 Tax=Marinospirillum sp. TaxID=2183934 RepID=UPI002B490FD5|nr:ribosome biogenesis GTP-binding protein YihA/YsxC [Marinospirillum sp.]HKM14507.1 ribosome biogenesis GTP-binding protein YihA/YsxC [Marinospirillum sp.]